MADMRFFKLLSTPGTPPAPTPAEDEARVLPSPEDVAERVADMTVELLKLLPPAPTDK
jgi:hypothetical protein